MNPQSGAALDPIYHSATAAEVDEAVKLASQAFASYSQTSSKACAALLRRAAEGFERQRDALAERAHLETALPMPRLLGEVSRTAGQLRLFASVVEEGSWVNARVDPALPDRQPMPRPDIRSMLRPLGPVAVFGASNFPLAFSVAGGDTASALAAGCPVVVKAHPAHPGTGELAAQIIAEAVAAEGLHPGVFSLVFDRGLDAGTALVKHPLIRAVAFTGSLRAGRALMDLAVARPTPFLASLRCRAAIRSLCCRARCAKGRPRWRKGSSDHSRWARDSSAPSRASSWFPIRMGLRISFRN